MNPLEPHKPNPKLERARIEPMPGPGFGMASETGSGYGYGYNYGYGYGDGYGYGGHRGGARPLLNRSFQDYINWYLRHFWVLILTALLGLFYGFYDYSITPPVFQSWTAIEVQRFEKEAADVDEEEVLRLGGAGEIASMVEKLQVPALYEAVARSNLFANRAKVAPEQKHWVMPWEAFASRQKDAGEKDAEKAKGDTPSPESLSFLMKNWVTVRWRTQTTLLDLYAKHTDPEVARDVLQGVLSEYERMSQENVGASENYAFQYILEKSDEVKDAILGIEERLNRYNRCLELSSQIDAARREVTLLEKRYLPKWPKLIEANEYLAILKRHFSGELEKVLASSSEEADFWRKSFSLKDDAGEEEKVEAQLKTVDARANLLRKELSAEETILGSLSMKLKEGAVSRGFLAKQFAVVQPPTLPSWPVEPNRNSILKKFTVTGFAIGFVLVFIMGLIDPSIRTVADLENMTAVPVLGAIPLGRGQKKLGKKSKTEREVVLIQDPNSQQSEALRTLRAGLTYLGDQEERKTFLVTSALASEGKSWIAANLAVAFAQQGDRTLLIDSDLRRAILHNVFHFSPGEKGLSDLLSKQCTLDEVINETEVENLYFLGAGGRSPNPAEVLASRNLARLVNDVDPYFDRVIFDSAPLVLVSDALAVAKHVQSVLLAYRIGHTPRRALFRALKYLEANRTPTAGLIANQLPATKTRRAYGYYYSFSGGGGYESSYGRYGPLDDEEESGKGEPEKPGPDIDLEKNLPGG